MDWLLNMANWFGSAVCHQLAAHSYQIDGTSLPLCARCTGLYLGALLTLIFLAWRRPRGVGMPRPWILVMLVLFFCAWAGDGLNSFLSMLPLMPHLYEPANWLRMTTGTLMGITMGSLIFVLFNSLVWYTPSPEPIFATRREFLALLGLGALLVLFVQSACALLLSPLLIAILIAILGLHTMLVTALVANLTHPAPNKHQVIPAFALGMIIALTYLSAIALLRMILLPSL